MAEENQELRKAGLKVTLPRVKILQILESTDPGSQHLSAEDVYGALRDAGEDVGLATVYRVLTQFESAGLVIRHNFETGHSVFELAKGELGAHYRLGWEEKDKFGGPLLPDVIDLPDRAPLRRAPPGAPRPALV